MAPMERERRLPVGPATVHLLGTVHGLRSEAELVKSAFAAMEPDAVGLAISPEDLAGLEAYVAGPAEPPSIPIDDPYVQSLARYGELAAPPPDLETALRLAREANVPTVALDLTDAAYTDAVTEHVSAWQLLSQSRRERRLAKRGSEAPTAWEHALAWDAERRKSRGYARVEELREEHVAQAVRHLAAKYARVLVVVEVARVEGVARHLGAGGGTAKAVDDQS